MLAILSTLNAQFLDLLDASYMLMEVAVQDRLLSELLVPIAIWNPFQCHALNSWFVSFEEINFIFYPSLFLEWVMLF